MNCKLAPPNVNVYSEQFHYKSKKFLQNGLNSCEPSGESMNFGERGDANTTESVNMRKALQSQQATLTPGICDDRQS